MKKILQETYKNTLYVNRLPSIYLVVCWAKYGVMELKVAKWVNGTPYVYQYDDHNGTTDAYYLRPYYATTTGDIVCMAYNEKQARDIASALNEKGNTK